MKPPTALATLQSLARDRSSGALARLGEALAASRTSAERLALLEGYRDEYRARLAAAVRAGVSATELANYRAFLDKLEHAVAQAAAEVAHRSASAEAHAAHWRDAQQREKSFDVLADRRAAEARASAERQGQKLTDEIAARIAAARPVRG